MSDAVARAEKQVSDTVTRVQQPEQENPALGLVHLSERQVSDTAFGPGAAVAEGGTVLSTGAVSGAQVLADGQPIDEQIGRQLVEARIQENLRLPDACLLRFTDPG